MLVLSRKRNEKIVIDGQIVVTIVDIRGDKVRLGIEAPKDVSIHRSEVYEALKREQEGKLHQPSQDPAEDHKPELNDSRTFQI